MGEAARSEVRDRQPFLRSSRAGGAIVTRDRFLSAAEIRQVWRALDEPERFNVSRDAATALRLILVTAARPGMVAGMSGNRASRPPWAERTWAALVVACERMKAAVFITPLSGLALELLRRTSRSIRMSVCSILPATNCTKRRSGSLPGSGWNGGRRTTCGARRRRSSTGKATRLSRSARCSRIPARALTAVYARWDKFDLRREMAMVIERSLRETLDGVAGSGRRRLNYLSRNRET